MSRELKPKDITLRYFKPKEFTMNHGTVNVYEHMDVTFLKQLDELRHRFGYPMSPSSTYRTESYNTAIKGNKNSMHLLGRAADIPYRHYSGEQRIKLIQIAIELGLTVGVRHDIMHFDNRKNQTVFGY